MRILSRYLLKAAAGPFVFALGVLTGLLMINTVARRIEDLAGKGLPIDVIIEVFILSLPHVLALTLPMAVLVAVLHAFSQLAADNEVTALKASGINLARLAVPLLAAATVLAGVMLWFNDDLLPDTNHRLKNLLIDVSQKSPTLQLKERVINAIPSSDYRTRYYLQAADVDPSTNILTDVVIWDLSDPQQVRTIYADSGQMAFNQQKTDLFLTLYSGHINELEEGLPERFQRVFFDRQILRMRGIGNVLDRSEGEGYRGEREMGFAMLANEAEEREQELKELREEAELLAQAALQAALQGQVGGPRQIDRMLERARAGVVESGDRASPAVAAEEERGAPAAAEPEERGAPATEPLESERIPIRVSPADRTDRPLPEPGIDLPAKDIAARVPLPKPAADAVSAIPADDGEPGSGIESPSRAEAVRRLALARDSAEAARVASRAPLPRLSMSGSLAGQLRGSTDPLTVAARAEMESIATRAHTRELQMNAFEVEYQKKLAIPFACVVFVLIGAPLAVRFPRGGIGMVIAISLSVFAIYYVGLIGGEKLADKGYVDPFWAMWVPNAVFLLFGVWGMMRIGHEASTSRGGGWDDLVYSLKRLLGAPMRRLRRRVATATRA